MSASYCREQHTEGTQLCAASHGVGFSTALDCAAVVAMVQSMDMKSGFAHFDGSDRENFIAAVLLLTMELDEAVKAVVIEIVRDALGIEEGRPLLSFGREARLEQSEDGEYARADLWFLFGPPSDQVYGFVEIKTHDNWDHARVADQVRDQCKRAVVRNPHPVRGSVLLGPDRLVRDVRGSDATVLTLTWSTLLSRVRTRPLSPFAELALRHIEDNMERPAGLDRPLTLSHFEPVGCVA